MSKKLRNVPLIFFEVFFVLFLISALLFILNFFNILNVYKSIPVFSSIIQSDIDETNGFANKTIISFITPPQAEVYENESNDYMYKPVLTSSLKVESQLSLDLEIFGGSGSGALIFNNTLDYSSPEYRHIRLFYVPNEKVWNLEFRSKQNSQKFLLSYPGPGLNFKKFEIIISRDGKKITALTPGQKAKIFDLSDSLYDNGRNMNSIFQIAPNSKITVHSFYYEY